MNRPTLLHPRIVLGPWAIVAALLAVMATTAPPAAGAVPAAHRFIRAYEDSTSCTTCHTRAAVEVMATSHWTWEHTDPATGQRLGKNNIINNYCIALPSNEPRCTSCHVGVGYADKNFNFQDGTKVDCLICHDTTGTYKKFPTGAGHPVYDTPKEFPVGSGIWWNPPDLLDVARHAGKSSRATCGACHFYGGGGDAVKHGDLDSTLLQPTRQLDVHMGREGGDFECAECHRPIEHRIPGTTYPAAATDNQMCESCHTLTPHPGSTRLNDHVSRVACQTCHIPAFARGGHATKMWWDWSKAGQKDAAGKNFILKDAEGNPIYDTQKGEFTWEKDVIPEYRWFNGGVTYVTLDTPVDPSQVTQINRLLGDVSDSRSRIFPVKRFRGIQPYDAATRRLAVPHLFGSDTNAYWRTFNWSQALTAGMQYIGRTFSGEVGFLETEMFWIENHMVAPKEQALSCTDCHLPGGRLDFVALGYPAERAAALQSLVGFEIAGAAWDAQAARVKLTWIGTTGYRYQVQTSENLREWADAPGGERAGSSDLQLEWWDEPAGAATGTRFYRITRTRDTD